uniref:Uncharacterized protein n=1 Tax=Megaselia scalaris TaxID=36166 RepID=T1H497_MEGSC
MSSNNCIVPSLEKHNFTCLGNFDEDYICTFRNPNVKAEMNNISCTTKTA